jgi:hypothetical protein
MPKANVNDVILRSIPIDKGLKRYFISKYGWLCRHNGPAFAADVFKTLREVLLAYRADPRRVDNFEDYLSRCPVRKNGWLRKLFMYMDSHPEYVLQFLKLYVGLNEPLVTVTESANSEDAYLHSRESAVNSDVPSNLKRWLEVILGKPLSKESYQEIVWLDRHGMGFADRALRYLLPYMRHHSWEEYMAYIRKWKRITWIHEISDDELREYATTKEPLPEVYVDFDSTEETSASLERDLWNFAMCEASSYSWDSLPVIAPQYLVYCQELLNPAWQGIAEQILEGEYELNCTKTFLDGMYVGDIHHIPKKGTVVRRPIAVPNRIFQMGMAPASLVLEKLLKKFPQDATYNQHRFDKKITNRVCNPNLYVGSVDLSKATDNLPLSWGEYIWDTLIGPRVSDFANQSWGLFVACSQAAWNNDGILSRWTVGQPLGCLPSFKVLGLTHNMYLESLALANGYGHSPYAILGDDVVIFTKKLRKKYISDLQNRGIPLSLHKSYEGNLTEFAGKTYVRNHVPFYTSDQSPVHYNNLFDYQRATGIAIPWDHLPRSVRKRFAKQVVTEGGVTSLAPLAYQLIQVCTVTGGVVHSSYDEDELIKAYFYFDAVESDKDTIPDPNLRTGIVKVGNHPISYLDYGYAEKHGYKQRFREIGLPVWYKQKFRPVTTDMLARCATYAIKDVDEKSSTGSATGDIL